MSSLPSIHISVAGNIGAGKSTLVALLAASAGLQPFPESVADHPYLADYYVDPSRWAFHSQIAFLTQRLEQHRAILAHAGPVCQERSIYEDYAVFGTTLWRQGILSGRDFRTYERLFRAITADLPPPTLLVWLTASIDALQHRIVHRGRHAERGIAAGYLAHLERGYHDWMAAWNACPVLAIATDAFDLAGDPVAQQAVVQHVRRAAGL
jgi:deoxyadenosine/deoxycytidine kinase